MTQRKLKRGLANYISKIGNLPKPPLICLDTNAEHVIWEGLRNTFFGASLWLRYMLLGKPLLPEAYEKFLYSQVVADGLANLFRLVVGVYPKTSAPELRSFSDPAELWYVCCCKNAEQALEDAGVTGRATLKGKRQMYDDTVKFCKIFEFLDFRFAEYPPSEKTLALLFVEAANLAKTDKWFHEKYFLPYLREKKRIARSFMNCKEIQRPYLLPGGKLFITGKNAKLPRSKQKL